ncbi:MAG: hypothetical protein HKN23_15620, partial [Verrucomicrobiales bacterium]|nr:hypothetical protein [Verrucomicrobiales bacterium]
NEYLRLQTEIKDLENKYATLHDELKELAEQQRDLAEKAAEEAKSENADQQTRDELAAEQSELNSKLEKLAEKMESATRDKPLYDLEKDLQKVLNEEAQAIRDSVAQNQEGLEQFLNGQPSPQSTQQFSEEGEQQADRLDPAREQAEQEIAEALEDAQKMQELLKAVNAYQQLYAAQEELAKQTQPYKDKPQSELSREDQLALQEMANTERQIKEGLEQVEQALREGAENAEEAYPEAAQDARNIADAIQQANLANLADGSAKTMQAGKGDQSHGKAEHLRSEMEKLMSECNQCQGGGAESEFTQRLKLMRGMAAGDTFSQMAQCKKFGKGNKPGGMGEGLGGMMGTGQSQMGENKSLLGGESMLGQRDKGDQESVNGDDNFTMREGPLDANVDKSDVAKSADNKREIRPAKSVTGDLLMNEYDDVVDAYFKKLTTGKKKGSD